jgi:hypothetical protein
MATRLVNLRFEAVSPVRLARFWAATLGWEVHDESHDVIGLLPTDGTRFIMSFGPGPASKTAKNPIHLDLVSESVEHQREIVDRLIALGARHADVGQGADADHVVLEDVEGNEFCIVIRGEFLADTGFLGAVVFEPAYPATGHFWAQALDWPVVYEEGGDVAIRAPDGTGPFITFGPPGNAQTTDNRLHLYIAPYVDEDQAPEIDRLIALGARRVDFGQGDRQWVVLADPNGNEFCVLRPQ